MPRISAVLMVALAVAMFLTACSGSGPGGETTCREWLDLQLPIEEQLLGGQRSEEQLDIVEQMLDDHGIDTTQANISIAQTQITEFCGIGSTVNTMNADRPIEDAIDWS